MHYDLRGAGVEWRVACGVYVIYIVAKTRTGEHVVEVRRTRGQMIKMM